MPTQCFECKFDKYIIYAVRDDKDKIILICDDCYDEKYRCKVCKNKGYCKKCEYKT